MRDSIRQLILENMLDDRHDLTGNSIYGLKFDTTVIPGDNTHGRASVQISASIPHPFPSTSDDSNSLPEVAGLVFGSKALLLSKSSSQTIRDSYTLYQDWLGSVLARMNNYANRAYAEKIANSKNGESCGPETVVQQTPEEVMLAGLAGTDGAAEKTLDQFMVFLARLAGDAAMALQAHGGVYLAGGIVPSLAEKLRAPKYRAIFEEKGRLSEVMRDIPLYVITDPFPAFKGCASALNAK